MKSLLRWRVSVAESTCWQRLAGCIDTIRMSVVSFIMVYFRRGAGVVERSGLENRRGFTPSGGSNPPPSATRSLTQLQSNQKAQHKAAGNRKMALQLFSPVAQDAYHTALMLNCRII